ncbi:MAG: hypothetical protein ACJ78Q_03350 [Chloroflexia bacterium]
MQQYTRLVTPRFRRFTIRFSGFEIEFRARPQVANTRLSPGERALRRARVEDAINRLHDDARTSWLLHK